MHNGWKWQPNHGQVLRLGRVIRCWRIGRDRCGLTPKQTRLLLKGAALEEDVAEAEKRYNQQKTTETGHNATADRATPNTKARGLARGDERSLRRVTTPRKMNESGP